MHVLSAAGVQFETDMTFSALHQVLDPLRDRFEGLNLNPTPRAALNIALGLSDGSVPEHLVVSTAALGLLREVAAGSPILIVVDDLPWIDRASAIGLGFVARRIAGTRIAFLAAARSEEEQVLIESGLPRLDVRPLDDRAASTLVNSYFPDLDRRLRQVLMESARGNPLALLEFGAALSERRIHTSRFLSVVTPQGSSFTRCPARPVARGVTLREAVQSTAAERPEIGQQEVCDSARGAPTGVSAHQGRCGG
jgi:hypothetical protein